MFRVPIEMKGLFDLHGRPCPDYLAYVEWFTTPQQQRSAGHTLYRVRRSLQGTDRLASVVPLASIRRSAQLMPNYGRKVPAHWSHHTVLDSCPSFYINPYSDRHAFHTIV